MTRGIYAHTLKTVVTLLDTFEFGRNELNEAGLHVGPVTLLDDNSDDVGTILFDADDHPVWIAATVNPALHFAPGTVIFDREADEEDKVKWDEVYAAEDEDRRLDPDYEPE